MGTLLVLLIFSSNLFVSVYLFLNFILCELQSLFFLFCHMFRLHVCFTFFLCIVLCSILLHIRIKHDEGVVLPTCSLTIGSQLLTYSSITAGHAEDVDIDVVGEVDD